MDGHAIRFETNNSPLRALKRLLALRWTIPTQISTLFVVAYVFIYSSNFLILLNPLDALDSLSFSASGGGVKDVRTDDIEKFKADFGIGIYVSVLLYTLFFLRPVIKTLLKLPHLIVIIFLLLLGMRFSDNPQQVFFSVVQIGIGILIAILYALHISGNERWDRKFCQTILFPLVLVHLYSLILFFANGFDVVDYFYSSKRFGGLPGNPNVAGASAVIGIWSCLYLFMDWNKGIFKNMYYAAALLLFVFTIGMSGSGTATSVSLALIGLMVWLKFLAIFKDPKKKALYIGFGVLVMGMLVGYAMINSSTEKITESFATSLGKQSDFTGRTDLWDIAVDAIIEKPVLGWSFDQHETIQGNRKYELPFGLAHFHNGFLDTAVAGGLVLLAFIIWNMFSYVKNYFKACVKKEYLYGIICPVVILVLMNLSEYSLLRPLNVVFQFYLCAYFLIFFAVESEKDGKSVATTPVVVPKPKKARFKRRRSTRRGDVRYRF